MMPEVIEGHFRSGYRSHVAEEAGRLLGVVAVRDKTHLYHLFVAEPHQDQGLARELWSVAKEACVAAGSLGEFTVNSSRFALGMYRKFGFVESGPAETKKGVVYFPMKCPASLTEQT